MKTSLKASLIALAIASIPLGSQAAGLGQINVFSGLGQPLRAEIQVSASPQELQSLTASIASVDAFRRANISYSAAVAAIRVSVDTRASRPVIRLSSDRPINDPFVDLLVELNWANGGISREYTFLLDPVDVVTPRPLAAAVDVPAAPSARPRPAAAPVTASASRPVADSYTVRRGDTLNRIAAAHAQPGVALDQMLVALYRANRDAFDGGNINRLRAGEVLSVPGAEAARAIDVSEARREIRAQSADVEAYRRGLATAATRRPPAAQDVAAQESAGRIVPRVDESKPLADSGDQVKVSRSQSEGGPGGGDANTRLQALEEELATREKALEEANARLAQLESSIRDMQKLLELRSGAMAQLQQGVPGGAPVPTSPPVASEAPAAAVSAPAVTTAPVAPASPEAVKPAAQPETPPKPPVRQPPPPKPEPTMMESLLGDPTVVAGGAGILALLLGYLGIKLRQRRQTRTAQSAAQNDLAPGNAGVFASTGGQSVDTGASSIMQTDFSQAGLSAIDADEGVDPVAEADVYMAYGRDAQAEEILQDALKADPSRAAIYLKLLEVYAHRRDARQFETLATEFFARTNGQGRDWEKAATLGRKLDPQNPLYAESQSQQDTAAPRTEIPTDVMGRSATVAGTALVGGAALEGLQAQSDAHGVDDEVKTETAQPASLASLDFTTAMSVEPSQSQMRDTWTAPGDLSQFAGDKSSDLEAEAPEVEQVEALEMAEAPGLDAEAPIDMNVIDFELDLGDEVSPSQDADARPAQAETSAEAVQEDAGLTFDLELDEPAEQAATIDFGLADDATPASAMKESSIDAEGYSAADATMIESVPDLSASLDFELPDMDLPAPKTEAFDLNQTVLQPMEISSRDEDDALPAEAGELEHQELEASPVVDLEKSSFDSSLLDFDFDLDTPVSPSPVGAKGLDLTSIDLELDNFDAPDAAPTSAPAPLSIDTTQLGQSLAESEAEEPVFDVTTDEVDTKLELARAYDDMGDKEGALELLEEVLNEGSEAQQAVAREMIARLS